MDTAKLYDNLPFIVLLAIMVMLQIAPDAYKPYLFWGGMFGCIAIMFGTDYILTVEASKYQYILGIERPTQNRLHIWVKMPDRGPDSRLIDPVKGIYRTVLPLAQPIVHPTYGKIQGQVEIDHKLAWGKRMMSMAGKAVYKGYPVSHNAIHIVDLWIPKTKPVRIDHLETIPRYILSEGVRDWYVWSEPAAVQPTYAANGGQLLMQQTEQPSETTNKQIADLQNTNRSLDTKYRLEHQRYIQLEDEVAEIRNEFEGKLGKPGAVGKLVFEEIMTLLSAHTEITEAVNELKPREWFKITRNIVLLALGGLGIYFFATNLELRAWVSANQIFLIIMAAIVFLLSSVVYVKRR